MNVKCQNPNDVEDFFDSTFGLHLDF